jgi:RNA-directed DNA polymerase
MYLEPEVEPIFHSDSYGYRPKRSALDAVEACRKRCWKYDWVIDLDIRAFFDSIDHDLMLKAVSRHTNERWILLYIERWLKAPLEKEDGTTITRDQGTAQGSAISPLLANLFLHYAFDSWMVRNFPSCPYERYADDGVIHCATEQEAREVLAALSQRMADVGLELHLDKTRIVYCKDANRKGSYECEQFDFLGYRFRPRLARNRSGQFFVGFLPAISNAAIKAIGQKIRDWRLNMHSDKSLTDLAGFINPILRGWINYYGRFYPSRLFRTLKRIDEYIIRWARRKYKRLSTSIWRALKWLRDVKRHSPSLFAHWQVGTSAR